MNLIIEHPELVTGRQKMMSAAVTAAFWAAWVYLWLPLVSFVAWMLGFELTYHHMVELEGFRALLQLLGIYALVILLMGGSLIAWALYNYLRFRGVERRRERAHVQTVVMADHFGVHPGCLPCFQDSRRLVVHHDGEGQIVGVDVGDLEWRAVRPCPRDEDPANCRPFLDIRAEQLNR